MNRRKKTRLLIGLTLLAVAAVMSWQTIPQAPAYHQFCDQRSFLGIPNFSNVISNLGFLVVGVLGLLVVGPPAGSRRVSVIYSAVFTGVLLTALGSAYYHWHPGNGSLVYDRLPMTFVFMGMVAAVLEEVIGGGVGLRLLGPLLVLGFASVWWWHYTEMRGRGDLRLYILVQYYPLLLIPLVLLLFPNASVQRGWRPLLFCFICYGLAKVAEALDCPIYSLLRFISGHTIKHLLSALACWYLVVRYRRMEFIRGL